MGSTYYSFISASAVLKTGGSSSGCRLLTLSQTHRAGFLVVGHIVFLANVQEFCYRVDVGLSVWKVFRYFLKVVNLVTCTALIYCGREL